MKIQIHEPEVLHKWRGTTQPRSHGAVEEPDWAGNM